MIELCVFLSGAIVMSFEILGSRLLTPNFGNTLHVWGSLISVFLGGLTLGYWMGGNLADRKLDRRLFAMLFIIPGLMLCAVPFYAEAVSNWIWDFEWDERYGSLAAALLLFLVPTLFLGAISPYAIRLRITSLLGLGAGVGNLYAISSLGSIMGTLITSFYLISWIRVSRIIMAEGLLLLLLGGMLMFWKKRNVTSIIEESL